MEKVIALAGNQNRYQYFTLAVVVFLWVNCNFISCVLTFIERPPLVNYTYNNITYTNQILSNDLCNEFETNGTNYTKAESYKYSWIEEYGLECKTTEISNIGSFAMFGNAAGGFVFSFINKFLAHKKILIISSFGFCIAAFLGTLVTSPDYIYALMTTEIFLGLFGNCLCYSSLVVAQEIVSNKKRSLFVSLINIGYSLCGIIYAILFYLLDDWRIVYYVLIGASLVTLILIWIFIYDSPRGYMNSNNYDKVIEILEGIASFNGKLNDFRESIKQDEYQEIISVIKGERPSIVSPTENSVNSIQNHEESGKESEHEFSKDISEGKISNLTTSLVEQNEDNLKVIKIKPKINVWSLFKYPSIRYKFLLLNFVWIGTRASFNGVTISSKSFPGNFVVNMIILYILETISYTASGFLIDIKKLGRRGTLWILYSLLGIIVILLISLNMDSIGTAGSLILNYFSRYCTAGIEVIYYTYSVELYPTPVRSVAFGVNAFFGNLGSVVAPIILEFLISWQFLTIIGIITVANAVVLIFLPETVGKPMVESIKELEGENYIYQENEEDKNQGINNDKDNNESKGDLFLDVKEEKKKEENKEEKKEEKKEENKEEIKEENKEENKKENINEPTKKEENDEEEKMDDNKDPGSN